MPPSSKGISTCLPWPRSHCPAMTFTDCPDGDAEGAQNSDADQRLGLAENGLAVELGHEVDAGDAVVGDVADLAAELDQRALLRVRHDDGPGEARAEVEQAAGIAEPVGDDAGGDGHGEHAVRDDVGKADFLGERLVPVDRVEVERGAGVADELLTGDPDLDGRELVADVHASSPRTTSWARVVQSRSPAASVMSARRLMKSLPARAMMWSM